MTAANGIAPNATQNFNLTVSGGTPTPNTDTQHPTPTPHTNAYTPTPQADTSTPTPERGPPTPNLERNTHTYPERDARTYPSATPTPTPSPTPTQLLNISTRLFTQSRRKCCDRRVHHRGQ